MTPNFVDEQMSEKRHHRAHLLAEIQAASSQFQEVCLTLDEEDLSADDLATIKANLLILRGTQVSLGARIATLEDRLTKTLSTGAMGLGAGSDRKTRRPLPLLRFGFLRGSKSISRARSSPRA